jgi:hypothetical protein
MRVKVQELSDGEFTTNVNAVKTKIAEKDKNQQEEFDRYWRYDITSHSYLFKSQD